MDFKRTQILLLIFFIVFDIYLGLSLLRKVDVRFAKPNDGQSVNIEARLKARNIKFNHSLSDAIYSLPVVKVDANQTLETKRDQLSQQTVRLTNGQLTSVFETPIDLAIGLTKETQTLTEEQVEQIKQDVLRKSEWFIQGDAYTAWSYSPENRILTFYMIAQDGKPIVDGTAELRLVLNTDYAVREYTQTYQTNFMSLDSPVKLITEKDALGILEKRVDTYIQDGATIQQIRLGYYRTMHLSDIDIYSPAWEITYSQDDTTMKTVLVDAIDQQVVTRTPFNAVN